MPQVQIQRLDRWGSVVEAHDVDLRDNHEYVEIIRPIERLARECGGSTRTVGCDSPMIKRAAP